MWLPQSFIAVLFAVLAQGALTNTTVDDTISFTFGGTWTALSKKSPCTSTPIPFPPQPDPSQTFGETWHVGTIHPGAPQFAAWGSFTFQGSAVYIFGIDQAGQAEIDFVLDQITNPHHYTGTQQFAYHALFFSATGLNSDQLHTVHWSLKATENAVQSALFDYAVVTSGEEGMPTTGGVTNSGTATTPSTTPSSSEVPSEPVTASATPSRTGSNAMSSLTGQGHSTGNESQPGSGASQPCAVLFSFVTIP
ncbi:hypothetical protein B0H14DRAFT_101744 [Mycena olivaceomarginata]|nr:hypothetical protein B0H14DRAFT_101744 [Mycena olivaceomarginata]